jgi:hypothetical protein
MNQGVIKEVLTDGEEQPARSKIEISGYLFQEGWRRKPAGRKAC